MNLGTRVKKSVMALASPIVHDICHQLAPLYGISSPRNIIQHFILQVCSSSFLLVILSEFLSAFLSPHKARRDDIAVADMVADMVADIEVYKVADKVADMGADTKNGRH